MVLKNPIIKTVILSLIFILALTGNIFSTDDINSYDYLKLKIDNSINFEITKENKFNIEEFKVNSYFFPKTQNGTQYLNGFESTNQNYNLINDSGNLYLVFNYDSNTLQEKNKIQNEFMIESTFFKPEIELKCKYPYTWQSESKFLEFSGLIDSNDKIKSKASELAKNKDDTYVIATEIAKWIKEDVNYDLSTVTQNPNQKSTQVFDSKAGVCKEITNLFVSMMRSLGIPARVVSGYAYTNQAEVVDFIGSNWGAHAWAEVYICGEWVPFDLTYDQYGYVDASHIIINQKEHIDESSVSIDALGYGFSIVENSLKVSNDFEILDKKNLNSQQDFNINIIGPDELSFGSYGYLQVNLENKKDYYNVLYLRLAKVKGVETIDNDERLLIFEPNENKKIIFKYKLPEDLEKGYLYTFPFSIYNHNLEKTFNLTVKEDYPYIKEIGLPIENEEQTSISDYNLVINCDMELSLPENLVSCNIKNPNNYEINNLKVCFSNDCQSLSLKLNEEKNLQFKTLDFEGTIAYFHSFENGNFKIGVEKPQINYTYTNNGDKITFEYNITNFAQAVQVLVYNNDTLIQTLTEEKTKINLSLNDGINSFKIDLIYNGKVLETKNFNVTYDLENPIYSDDSQLSKKSLWQKIIDWFKSLF